MEGPSAEANLTTPISLPNQDSVRAFEILEAELLALRPQRWQRIAYQLLQLDVAVFVIALAIALLAGRQSPAFTTTGYVGLFTTVALFFLIPVNAPLIFRLWRGARIRRQLGWDEPLKPAFGARRRHKWVRNAATALLAVLGAYLIGYVVLTLAAMLSARDQSSLLEWSVRLIIVLLYLVVGVTLLGLHFVRRAMDRFAVAVEQVQARFSAAVKQSQLRRTNDVAVEPDDYEVIAQLEREQIMRDRLASVAEHGEAAGYAVQIGLEAQQAKAALPPADQQLVDDQIFRLADSMAGAPALITHSLHVVGTSIELQFEVDHAARRLRIVGIVRIGRIGESGIDRSVSLPS